jgi:hypothetical protein
MQNQDKRRMQAWRAIAGGIILFGTVSCTTVPQVHWTFDVSHGEVRDRAGNCHGTLEGDIPHDCVQPGIFGNALHFDNGRNRVRVPYHPVLSLEDSFAVEVVLKPFRIDSFRTILWQGDRTVKPERISYYVDLRDGRPELKTKDAQGRWIVYATREALTANEWHHVMFTFRAGNVEIHIDGVAREVTVSENGERGEKLLTNTCDVVLGDGANQHGRAYAFCGLIDDVKFHRAPNLPVIGEDYPERWQALRARVQKRERAYSERQSREKQRERKRLLREYDALLRTHGSGPDAPFVATVLPASERLLPTPDFFRRVRRFTRTAALSAARREVEGFQVILMTPRDGDSVQVTATPSELVRTDGAARIPSEAIAWGRVERVTTETPDIPVAFTGAIPDVIFEDGSPVTVPPGDFGGLFCRIRVGNAPAGIYTGTLTIDGAGIREVIEIELEVYDFELPLRPSLRTAFCFFEHFYRDWYGRKQLTDAEREKIYEFLLDYRLSPCNIYSPDAPHPDTRFLKKYRDRINFFTIGRISGKTDEQLRESAMERAELIRQLQEEGLGEYLYFYSFDELSLHLDKLPDAIRMTQAAKEACPQLKLMQTSAPVPELQPLFNTWVPLFSSFASPRGLEQIDTVRVRGDEIWWYAADSPTHPLPNFFLDYPVFDCRIVGTLSYLQNVKGVLYWCINREWKTNLDIREAWPDAPWKPYIFSVNTGKRKYKNGMGNVVYPGKDAKLLSSLRLENLRDGLEDYEYWHALAEAVRDMEEGKGPTDPALLQEAKDLLKPPETAVADITHWSSDPTHLAEYRNRVGALLGRIHSTR